VDDFKHTEVVCIDICLCGSKYRVISSYHPPGFVDDALAYSDSSVKCLQRLCATNKLMAILGDFNLPSFLSWSE